MHRAVMEEKDVCSLKPGVHLIITIVMNAVIVQKQSISVITEQSLSHVHLIVPIIQKTYILARNQNHIKMNQYCSVPWEI